MELNDEIYERITDLSSEGDEFADAGDLEQEIRMSIKIVKHINKDEGNRVEYLFVNFDYFDGNDLVAKLFCQEYQMSSDEKIDGIYYSIIKLYNSSAEYNLIWHEDVGNYIFSTKQDEASILQLEQKLEFIATKLNEIMKA